MKTKTKIPYENRGARAVEIIFIIALCALIFNIIYLCTTGKGFASGANIRDYNKERGGGRVTATDYATRGTI